ILCLLLREVAAMLDIVFVAVSGLGTFGLSSGLTTSLSVAGVFILIFLMFFGRLWPLSLAYFLASARIINLRYPCAKIDIG
ncbi:potassium transporter TrkG, partial [Neptunomonas phycophila]